jgi:SPP1 gp7 family putative phage head morphogenesis protein
MPSPIRIDPSRTKTLRDKFRREFSKRFEKLKRLINDLVITEDAFGLVSTSQSVSSIAFDTSDFVGNVTQNNRWRFRSDSEKLQLFGVWLSQQISGEIVQGTELTAIEDAYWYPYVWEGYQRGVGRIFTDINKLSSLTEDISDVFIGSKKEFLRQSFSHPVSVERVKQVASRVMTDLKGVTDTMEAQIKRELIDGLTQGLHPKEVARRLNDRVEKIGKTRANTIAQTETIRAHAEGQLDGLERYGLDEIGVMSEWTTSGLGISGKGNPSPCELCAPLDGLVLTVKEARGLIPRHPNCKCTFKPANVGEPLIGRDKRFYDSKTKKVITRRQRQLRTKSQIEKALEQSKSAKKGSQWIGDNVKISKKRPPSPVN